MNIFLYFAEFNSSPLKIHPKFWNLEGLQGVKELESYFKRFTRRKDGKPNQKTVEEMNKKLKRLRAVASLYDLLYAKVRHEFPTNLLHNNNVNGPEI